MEDLLSMLDSIVAAAGEQRHGMFAAEEFWMWFTLAMLMLGGAMAAQAQTSQAQSWQGEWGAMQRSHGTAAPVYTGGRLTVSECGEHSCRMAIRVAAGAEAYCEAAGELTLENATTAVAHLPSAAEQRCSLTLRRAAEGAITSEQQGGGCSYYCTPGGSFAFAFPLRSTTLYRDRDVDACYAGDTAARAAICKDAELAALEAEWRERSRGVGELLKLPETAVQSPEQSCAESAAAAECLHAAYRKQIDELKEAALQWRTAETSPGDADQADRKIRAMEGTYRTAVKNGDITGRHYQTTNVLTIRRASKTSIAYSVELFFYNGHECSRSGTAEYRQSGSFVDESRDATAAVDGAAGHDKLADECFFEIRQTGQGVELADPTGACRQSDCGARGGYGGTAFSSARRVPWKH